MLTRARRRRRLRYRGALLLGALLLVGFATTVALRRTSGNSATGTAGAPPTTTRRSVAHRERAAVRLVERPTGRLAAPVQDEAVAGLTAQSAMLLGGLTAADTSRTEIRIAGTRSDRAAGALPTGLHDTAAAVLRGSVYLFGGGTAANTQSDAILRIPATGGTPVQAARLPAPTSDHSAVEVDGTAYVFGGYTGSQWLDTVVAWRPGRTARVVAHLPYPLRYAAVTVVAGQVILAGGSLVDGSASAAVLEFSPTTKRVTRIGTLPAPTTHAAAASIGDIAYVIGGRGAAVGTPVSRIVAIDVRRGRVHTAGSLASPRSDLGAASLGSRILLAGGRGSAGTEDGLSVLVAVGADHATRLAATSNVYAHDTPRNLTAATRAAKQLVYVPNSGSNTVDVIDPHTFRIVRHFAVGGLPQHVVPAWDLRTLYVTNDTGNTLTTIDPRTGRRGRTFAVADPYNMYFTPNGKYAIVVAERLHRLDFRDPHSFALRHSLDVPCRGVDHMDFTADGRYLIASCEFSAQMVVVDVQAQRVVKKIALPAGAMPQDVKLSPDGRIFYVADMASGGLWEVGAQTFRLVHFLSTAAGAHGLYPSRDARYLYVANRNAGSVSVVSFENRRVVATWRIPGGTPDMGGVSADGRVLWLSGRYRAEVYAISTRSGRLLARIPVGSGPHGLCVWPQPGRYSLGHTGILR